MDRIELRPYSTLKPHHRNEALFGKPEDDPHLLHSVMTSVLDQGVQEPLIILDDGTILSGHVRHFVIGVVAQKKSQNLDEVQVQVRIHPPFTSPAEEEAYLIEANLRRRQLSKQQLANLYDHLTSLIPKNRVGRPKKNEPKKPSVAQTAKNVARKLGISPEKGGDLVTVFKTEGVPEDVKEAVSSGELSEKSVSKAIRQLVEDGKVKDEGKLRETIEAIQSPPKVEEPPTFDDEPEPSPVVEPEPLLLHEQVAKLGQQLGDLLSEVPEDVGAFTRELRAIKDRIVGYLGEAPPAPTFELKEEPKVVPPEPPNVEDVVLEPEPEPVKAEEEPQPAPSKKDDGIDDLDLDALLRDAGDQE